MDKKTWIIVISLCILFTVLSIVTFLATGKLPTPFMPIQPIWPPILVPLTEAIC